MPAASLNINVGVNHAKFNKNMAAMSRSLNRFTQTTSVLSRTLGTVFAVGAIVRGAKALGGALAAPISKFAEFEQTIQEASQLTGTVDNFNSLSSAALKLGETTSFTANEAGQAMQNFARAGFELNEVLAATGPALNLATVGGLGLAQAADFMASALRSFGFDAENAQRVSDVFAKSASMANQSVEDIGNSMKFAAPIASKVGILFEELAAAVGLLADQGIKGEMAGTTLRQVMVKLENPSKKAAAVLDRLGIVVNDAKGKMLPLANLIGQFEDKLGGLGGGEQLGILSKIFEARAASGFAALLGHSQELIDNTKILKDSFGFAGEFAATKLDTLSGAFIKLKSLFDSFLISVGGRFAKVFDLQKVIEGWTTLASLLKGPIFKVFDSLKLKFEAMDRFDFAESVINSLESFGKGFLAFLDLVVGAFQNMSNEMLKTMASINAMAEAPNTIGGFLGRRFVDPFNLTGASGLPETDAPQINIPKPSETLGSAFTAMMDGIRKDITSQRAVGNISAKMLKVIESGISVAMGAAFSRGRFNPLSNLTPAQQLALLAPAQMLGLAPMGVMGRGVQEMQPQLAPALLAGSSEAESFISRVLAGKPKQKEEQKQTKQLEKLNKSNDIIAKAMQNPKTVLNVASLT